MTLACVKTGLLTPEAAEFVGTLVLADIGIPYLAFDRIGVDTRDLFKEAEAGGPTPLNTFNHNVTVSVGVNLSGVTYLSFSGTPWASDQRLARRFVVGLNIARPTRQSETKNGQTKTPSLL